jgi:hypothetical protein
VTQLPPQPPLPVAPVTLLDIYTRQVEMGAQLAVIHEQLKAIPDHEQRIRVLERAKATVWGAAAALGAVCGGGAAWIALAVTHR